MKQDRVWKIPTQTRSEESWKHLWENSEVVKRKAGGNAGITMTMWDARLQIVCTKSIS